MSKLMSCEIRVFFISLIIFLYSQGLAIGENGCFDNFSTLTGNPELCNPDWEPKWSPKNPEQITPFDAGEEGSGVATVRFDGGRPPYTWQVSGNGFWFDDQYTQTTIQTDTFSTPIYADENACGSALITVTDDCGKSGSGNIGSTVGVWGEWSPWIMEDDSCAGEYYSTSWIDVCEDNLHEYEVAFWGAQAYHDECPTTWTICSENCCVTFDAFPGFPRISMAQIREREWICVE